MHKKQRGETWFTDKRKKVIFIMLFYSWILFIFTLSSIPGSSTPSFPGGTDKIVHFLEYAILGFLAIQALTLKSKIVLLPGIVTPLLDEFYQSFTPGRYSDIKDVIADVAGYMVVIIIVSIWQKKSIERKDRKQKK